ncbi:penicillin-binding protein PBP2A [Streptococcus sp. V728]|uniref:penicillin-binding protein PBP2A n=1 Tax=Streptococcus sp. V728 TaxID=3455700 RepID=UPI003F93C14C
MKLDTLFEKFLSLFKKEESEIEETETNEVEHEGNESSNLHRSRAGRKKSGAVGPIRKFWRRYHLTKIFLIIGLSASLFVGVYLFALAKSTNVTDLQNALKTRTLIFDREEKEAGALSGQKGTYVELSDISEDLQNAVIATEDRSFYKNSGINYGRFFLAILTAGRSGGGSTITQQLAKNAYLSQDQTVQRKAKEFFLALELTKKYSKKEILTMYLNNAYFGNGVWGVEDASKKYFGVSASQLTLDEAATLAGMLKGPELYNPLNSIEDSTNRRDTVLQNMVAAGYIDKDKEAEASGVDMASQLQDAYKGKVSDYRYPSYFDAVINEAIEKYNLTEEEIVNNGYRIFTELDQNYQANMQVIYENTALFPTAEDGTHAESGSVALEPKTGGVRGVVGRVAGDDKAGFRNFNYATQSKRSPGSTIKPLVVYTPAVEAGWALNKELDNHTMEYGDYKVDNYAGIKTSPEVPMYQALAESLNLPAVATVKQLGIDKAFESGERFGLDLTNVDRVLGVALGGGVETNPLQMAQAYAAFANDGLMPEAHFITRIENASGQVIATHKNSQKRVIDKSVADKMTSMMLGTFTNGTGIRSSPDDYVMAGKTGTTEAAFNPVYTSDQWVIGYTPDVVISHWLGFPTTDESHYLAGSTSNGAAHIFRSMAETILPYTPGSTFKVENAYKLNGIAPQNIPNQSSDNGGTQSGDSITDIQGRAQNLIDEAERAISDAKIKEKAKTIWDTIVDLFQ